MIPRRLAAATALLSSFCAFGFTLPPAPADAAPCSRATAPTRAGAWRAYVPAGTPIRAPGRRTAITRVGAWRLVLGSARPGNACQLRVRLERRPNGASGWVAAARARLRPTRWRIEVDRDARRASLLRDGRIVERWKVVVGKRATQTPTGLFAVQASYRTPAASFEGRWIVTLTAHSNALATYDGGDGQVALHGRGGAALVDRLGTAASHGCVRFDNRAIGAIVRRVGRGRLPGIPVAIR